MSFPKSSSLGILFALFIVFSAQTLLADTYQLYRLANEANSIVYGLNDSGAVVLYNSFAEPELGCNTDTGGIPMGPCYTTYVAGVPVASSVTAPTVVNGFGPPGDGCTGPPAGVTVKFFTCVNGRQLVSGIDNSTFRAGVWIGSDIVQDKFDGEVFNGQAISGFGHPQLDGYGDIVYDSIDAEEIVEFYDVTTHGTQVPEPGSFALLGTGIAAAFKMRRNKTFSS